MQTESRCPFCGGEVVHDYFGESCRARCCKCGSTGPVTAAEHDAFHAFCHPAHLTVGMVMVSVGTAQTAIEALEIAYGEKDKDFVINPDVWSYEAQAHKDITAAIDAAKGEKV